MNIRKFVPILFVFCLFMGSQILLLPGAAYAWKMCCGCGSSAYCQYNSQCHCPGTAHCYWCAAPNPNPDLEIVHSVPSAPESGVDVDIRGVPVSLLTSSTERILSDIRRKHGRDVLALKLLGHLGSDRQFGCSAVDDNYLQSNITFALAATRQ
jgi:hypothetical protein